MMGHHTISSHNTPLLSVSSIKYYCLTAAKHDPTKLFYALDFAMAYVTFNSDYNNPNPLLIF